MLLSLILLIQRQLFIFGISPSIPQDIFRKDRSSNYRPRARSDKRSFGISMKFNKILCLYFATEEKGNYLESISYK